MSSAGLAACSGATSTASEARAAAPAAAVVGAPPAKMCFAGTQYAVAFAQDFHAGTVWRRERGGRWFTQYPWGRSNPGAKDAAFYADPQSGAPGYDPFSIADDALIIQAQPASRVPGMLAALSPGLAYVSGLISTNGPRGAADGFVQRYGYYEVAARLPAGRGVWPAFWMLDAHGSRAEVDAFELLGDDPTSLYQSVHYADGTGHSYRYTLEFDPTAGTHRYGVLVTPSYDYYYVDGQRTHAERDSSVGDFYFMISLQVGGPGSWPGPPDESTVWPAKLAVQYFRAYRPTTTDCS